MSSILNRNPVGLVLRTYATKSEDVPKRVEAIRKFVEKAKGIQIDGKQVFRQIDVLVWEDARFADADCGLTFEALKGDATVVANASVHRFNYGDLFCGVLNYAVAKQIRAGIDYTLIASTEALSYFTVETLQEMFKAAESGAKAVGVAINELTDSVLAGRLANMMCLWHNVSLMSVGGFDLRAAKPVDDKSAHYVRGWSSEKQANTFYHLAGVEEVIPLARLVEVYGSCLAPIMPTGDGVKQYQVPDPATQCELWERHIAKMGTKAERQGALLASIGCDLSYLKGGVMLQYRSK